MVPPKLANDPKCNKSTFLIKECGKLDFLRAKC